MKQSALLIPMHDLLIRDPVSKRIMAKEGEVKLLTGSSGRYWRRRLKDGSVKIGEMPKIIKQEKSKYRKTREE